MEERKFTITESDMRVLVELLRGVKCWEEEEVNVSTVGNSLQVDFEGYGMEFIEQE